MDSCLRCSSVCVFLNNSLFCYVRHSRKWRVPAAAAAAFLIKSLFINEIEKAEGANRPAKKRRDATRKGRRPRRRHTRKNSNFARIADKKRAAKLGNWLAKFWKPLSKGAGTHINKSQDNRIPSCPFRERSGWTRRGAVVNTGSSFSQSGTFPFSDAYRSFSPLNSSRKKSKIHAKIVADDFRS